MRTTSNERGICYRGKSILILAFLLCYILPVITYAQIEYNPDKSPQQVYKAFAVGKSGQKLAVSISPFHEVFLYDILTGKEIIRLKGHTEIPQKIYFDDIHEQIIAVYQSKVAVWNKSDYKLIHLLDIPSPYTPPLSNVTLTAYNEHLQHLAIVLENLKGLQIYDLAAANLLTEFETGSRMYSNISYSQSGDYLFIGSHNPYFIEQRRTPEYSPGKKIWKRNFVNFACGTNTIAVTSSSKNGNEYQNKIDFLDNNGNRKVPAITLKWAHQVAMIAASVNVDIQMLDDNSVLLENYNQINYIHAQGGESFQFSFEKEVSQFIYVIKLGFVTCNNDEINILDFEGRFLNRFKASETGKNLFYFSKEINKYVLGIDNRLLFSPTNPPVPEGIPDITSLDYDMLNRLGYNNVSPETKKGVKILDIGSSMINTFGSDGKYIAFTTTKKEIEIWNIEKEKKISTISNLKTFPSGITLNHSRGLVFTSFVDDPQVYVWGLNNGKLLRKLKDHGSHVTAIHATANLLAVGDITGNFTVWNLKDNTILASDRILGDPVTSLRLSVDGTLLAAGSFGRIVYFRINNPDNSDVFRGHNSFVRGIDISHDGKFLLSTSQDQNVKLWNINNGNLIKNYSIDSGWMEYVAFHENISFHGSGRNVPLKFFDNSDLFNEVTHPEPKMLIQSSHTQSVNRIVFNQQGNLMATITSRVVKIWDMKTGFILNTISPTTGFCNDAEFSADNKTLIIAAGKNIEFWDPVSGEQVKVIDLGFKNRSIHQISIIPSNENAFLATNLHGWHSPMLLHINSGRYSGKINYNQDQNKLDKNINDLKFAPDGRTIATYGSHFIKVMKILDNGSIQPTLSLPREKVNVTIGAWRDYLDFSDDGRYLSYSTFASPPMIVVYDLKEKREVLRRKGGMSKFGTGNILMYMDSDESLALLDIKENRLIRRLRCYGKHMGLITAMAYNPENNLFASGDEWGNVKLWDGRTGALIRENNRFDNDVYVTQMSPNGEFISYNTKQGLFIYDVRNMKLFETDGTNYPYFGSFSPDNRHFYYRRGSYYHRLDLNTFKSERLFKTDVKYKEAGGTLVSPDGNYLLFEDKKNDKNIIYDLNTNAKFAEIRKKEIPGVLNFHLMGFNPANSSELYGTAINSNNKDTLTYQLITYNFNKNSVTKKSNEREMSIKDMKGWDGVDLRYNARVNTVSQSGKYYAYLDKYHLIIKNLNNHKELFNKRHNDVTKYHITRAIFTPDEMYLLIADESGLITKLSLDTFDVVKVFKAYDTEIADMEVRGRFLKVFGNAEEIRVFDMEDNDKELYSLIPIGGDHFILKNPEGYYYASKRAHKGVAFKKELNIFPFEQFDLRFNRPDLALQGLAGLGMVSPALIEAYHNAYKKRLDKMNFTEDMFNDDLHLPEIDIISKDIPVTTKEENLIINIKATDSKYFLDRINLWINDVPVYGRNGIDVKNERTKTIERPIEFPLSYGSNKIQISVYNQVAVESLRKTVTVNCLKPEPEPVMHIVAIGVSRYQQERMNLLYASKDATNLTEALNIDENHVEIHLLTDEQATKKNIIKLKEVLLKTKIDDRVILFFAGHGLRDDRNYYLATHDIDFNDPSKKGLSYDEFENLLDGIPARNKVALIDACLSGEEDKDKISFEMMKELYADLRRSTGTTVISATGGTENAYESPEFENGIFTYCLIDGLKQGTADKNGDGKIRISELQEYLQKKVPELQEYLRKKEPERYKGHQQPTFRVENLANDWSIVETLDSN